MIANKAQQTALFYAHPVAIGQSLIGVVTQNGDGYRFHAFDNAFARLEDDRFRGADEARNAAIELSVRKGVVGEK
ncbi:hypothetical protein [Methylocystis bryophila]|uniref:Uncharacterized protein n=1 Tax=Methylocystis bryophila TaxID=655015 RepID=A0A1W6MSA5_9HYPH|nr:hypothetical protein [Methylocystis bryophila]ARN80474.1 hypothetical protein B1812_04630 [Methylocystis bryophila]BDV40496.1 hypothetical protein DSM21852_37490 [Methylocystis bryophila]